MFKKITSNRDPERTVWSEISTEFHPYINKTNNGFAVIIKKYPKQIFGSMLILICISAVLALTVLRPDPVSLSIYDNTKKSVTEAEVMKTSTGFLGSLEMLQRVMRLQNEVSSILEKTELTDADSLQLERKMKEIESIESTILK